jgi:hypothetical protein
MKSRNPFDFWPFNEPKGADMPNDNFSDPRYWERRYDSREVESVIAHLKNFGEHAHEDDATDLLKRLIDYVEIAKRLENCLKNAIDALENALGPEENRLGDPLRTILESNGACLQFRMLIERDKELKL